MFAVNAVDVHGQFNDSHRMTGGPSSKPLTHEPKVNRGLLLAEPSSQRLVLFAPWQVAKEVPRVPCGSSMKIALRQSFS